MRLIEKEMLRAINNRTSWQKDNTQVRPIVLDDNAISQVFLHGNHIADFVHGKQWGTGWLEVNKETLKAWPTRTTMSRLRALGADVYTRKGVVYHEGEAVA